MSVGQNQMNSQQKRNNGNVNWDSKSANANVTLYPNVTGITVDSAVTNVTDLDAVTNITINQGLTNITRTEVTGGFETRPANVTALPCIRY